MKTDYPNKIYAKGKNKKLPPRCKKCGHPMIFDRDNIAWVCMVCSTEGEK